MTGLLAAGKAVFTELINLCVWNLQKNIFVGVIRVPIEKFIRKVVGQKTCRIGFGRSGTCEATQGIGTLTASESPLDANCR